MEKKPGSNREIIDKYLEKEPIEYEEKQVKIGYDGKQFIIRIPTIISTISNLDQNKAKAIFKAYHKTKEIKIQIIKEPKNA